MAPDAFIHAGFNVGGPVQGFSLPGGELEDGAAGGSQGGVPLWRVVPSGGLHRDQPGQPGGGAVLQQAGNRGTVDQGGKASGQDDAAEVVSLDGGWRALKESGLPLEK